MLLVSFPSDSYVTVAMVIFLKSKSNVAPLLKTLQWLLKALINPIKDCDLTPVYRSSLTALYLCDYIFHPY